MDIVEVKNFTEDVCLALNALLPQLSPLAPVLTEVALRRIISAEATHVFIAVEQGDICGTATVVIMDIVAGKRARIEDVVVDEGMRRRGIGRQLITQAVQLAREKGAGSIELTSHPSRQAAKTLYLDMGFRLRETHVYTYCLR